MLRSNKCKNFYTFLDSMGMIIPIFTMDMVLMRIFAKFATEFSSGVNNGHAKAL
jgi:hypothetical protein